MAPKTGTPRLGPYKFTAQIGEGGMGEVYRARDTTRDRKVAIIEGLMWRPGAVAQYKEAPPCW